MIKTTVALLLLIPSLTFADVCTTLDGSEVKGSAELNVIEDTSNPQLYSLKYKVGEKSGDLEGDLVYSSEDSDIDAVFNFVVTKGMTDLSIEMSAGEANGNNNGNYLYFRDANQKIIASMSCADSE